MAIKSDKWIKQMAKNHDMIAPFGEKQVRYNTNNDKVISYGTSSYGYDIRCANEGVAQVLFFESDEDCETSYKDRGGKYMGQVGVTLPKA